MPRVSEVIDYIQEPDLVKWKLKVGKVKAEAISREALQIGTQVDQIIQDELNGRDVVADVSEAVANCLKGWIKFKRENPGVFARMRENRAKMQTELTLGDLTGHPDFILGDEVCDLKTSKSINKTHWMQTAQYGYMYDRMEKRLNPHIRKISILRLDKTSNVGAYDYKVLEEPFISFWQRQFEHRYAIYMEDKVARDMIRERGESLLLRGLDEEV